MAKTTVKPLYSGHNLDLEKVSTTERCPLDVCPNLAYFASKTLLRVLGYGEVDLK